MKKIISTLVIAGIVTLFCYVAAVGYLRTTRPETWSLSKAEIKYITAELNRRNAPDCVLTPTHYGWACEAKNGEIYKVKY